MARIALPAEESERATSSRAGPHGFAQIGWLICWTLIIVLGSWLRFGAHDRTEMVNPFVGDARDYATYALNLKLHGVYSRKYAEAEWFAPAPDALRPPGYPFFLAMFVSAERGIDRLERALWVQMALSIATLVIAIVIFLAWLPRPLALFAAILTAISPHLVNASIFFVTESLFTFLLTAGLASLIFALRQKSWWLWWATGLALGMATMVRPTTLFLVPVLACFGFVWVQGGERHRKLVAALVVLLPLIVLQGSWMARNYLAIGTTSDPTLSANFLQHGMYPGLMYNDIPESYGYPYRYDPRNAALSGDLPAVIAEFRERVIREPERFARWILVGKPMTFLSWHLTEVGGDSFIYSPIHSPYFSERVFRFSNLLARVLHPIACVLACMGLVLLAVTRHREKAGWIIAVTLLYFIAFHMVGAPFPRYAIPVRIPLYAMAGYAIAQSVHRWRSRR